jgi:hypothetical protein
MAALFLLSRPSVQVLLLLYWLILAGSNPTSKPYIAFRTDPFDQPETIRQLKLDPQLSRSLIHSKDAIPITSCPLQLSLGIAKRIHASDSTTSQAPVIYPAWPARGPGRQVVVASDYENLNVYTAAAAASTTTNTGTKSSLIKEVLIEGTEFPILFESSSFQATPIIADFNGDGRPDAILSDYDGGIYVVGLSTSGSTKKTRYFHSAQVPRLYIRREWLARRVNDTLGIVPPAPASVDHKDSETQHQLPDDPFHTYFEYYSSVSTTKDKILQGVSGNILGQDHEQVLALNKRRSRKMNVSSAASVDAPGTHQQQQLKGGPDTHNYNVVDVVEEHSGSGSRRIDYDGQGAHDDDDKSNLKGTANMDDLEVAQVKQWNKELGRKEPKLENDNGHHADHGHRGVDPVNRINQMRSMMEEKFSGETVEAQRDLEEGVRDLKRLTRRLQENLGEQNAGLPVEQLADKTTYQQPLQGVVHQQPYNAQQQQHTEHKADAETKQSQERSRIHDTVVKDPVYDNSDSGSKDERAKRKEKDRVLNKRRGVYDDYIADDIQPQRKAKGDDYAMDDPDYARYDDVALHRGHREHDDFYNKHNSIHNEYYDSKHYIRVPPHIIASPVLAELPKLYSQDNEMENILFVPVTYYFDEDEYEGFFSYKRFEDTDHGDENEVKRGTYVASAIMSYLIGETPRWTGQTHLDLSTDFTAPENVTIVGAVPIHADVSRMGAFALASPTVADIDGDGSHEVIIGTSMGIVYCFDARNMFKKFNWPIQMQHPIESRALVEDVVGDTNLEIFVADTGGNVVCLSHQANRIWHRNLAASLGKTALDMTGSSSMVLGDIDGDGVMDIVVVAAIDGRIYMFAFNAATGEDLSNFPMDLDKVVVSNVDTFEKLAQPLLVDLHADQSFLEKYIRRNSEPWRQVSRKSSHPRNGGSAFGLHIVYPSGKSLFIIEAGSGCTQTISIGEDVTAMVSVDDVHGTNRLDLVVATKAGNIVTLESASPYHPLNVWNNGETRGRLGGNAHGYSASQGVFVHSTSRQYVDIFGVYVPITFEIFDNRPNIRNEPARRKYRVEIRDGASPKRALLKTEYNKPGVYTERVYVRFGPGFYSLSVVLTTTHGLVYEDIFHIGYNVHFMSGFGMLLWLPLVVAAATIVFCGVKRDSYDDDGEMNGDRSSSMGILGRVLPT